MPDAGVAIHKHFVLIFNHFYLEGAPLGENSSQYQTNQNPIVLHLPQGLIHGIEASHRTTSLGERALPSVNRLMGIQRKEEWGRG